MFLSKLLMCPDWIFLKDVEGKLCSLFDFSWTDIDRFTFQVSPNEITPKLKD